MADDDGPQGEPKIVHVYPLVRYTDMPEDMQNEVVDVITTACEKYMSNYEAATKMIKDFLDRRYGPYWHAVAGEGFGFEVSYETKNILYMFFAGNIAIVTWKCS